MNKKIINVIVMVFALFLVLVQNNEISAATGNDISNKVTITKVDVQIRLGSEWHYIIKDGTEVPGHPPVRVGNEIKFLYDWNINDVNMAGVQENDYFKIPLPENYFTFTNMPTEQPLMDSDHPGVQLGTWILKDNEIVTTLSDIGASKNSLDNGYFNAAGLVTQSGSNIEITVPGLALPPITIDPKDDETEIEHDDFGYLNKHGNQLNNSNKINWGMFVNYGNYKKAYEGKPYDKLNNVMLTDDLEPGMIIDESSFEIAVKLHSPTSEGKMSSNVVSWINIMQQFEKISLNSNESYDDFYNRIKSNAKPAYGFFEGTRVIVNFKNLTGDGNGIKLNELKNDAQLRAHIQSKVAANEITQVQADGMFNAYSQSSAANGDALGFMVLFGADVTGGNGAYKNVSKLEYDNNSEMSNPVEVNFQEVTGGSTVGEPGSVIISKYDGDTNDKLEGVEFKLQRKDNNGKYIDYMPRDQIATRTTNSSGQVVFSNLHNGDYKIVEVSGLPGYGSKIEYSPSEFFKINGTETAGIKVAAYNYKDLGSVLLTKVDKETNNPLAQAQFSLYKENGTIISNKLISDDNGEIKVENLEPGNYYFIETKAPKDYILNKNKLSFKIESNQTSILKLMFENSKVEITPDPDPDPDPDPRPNKDKDDDKLPKTGADDVLLIVILTSITLSLISLGYSRKYYR